MPGVSGNKPVTLPQKASVADESEIEPEAVEEEHDESDESNGESVSESVIQSEAKNLAGAETDLNADESEIEPETVEEEPLETVETESEPVPESVIRSEAKNLAGAEANLNTGESEIEPEALEEEPLETVEEKSDEAARFKAATDGFDRLEKFTFKIFKDVFDNAYGINVTARQTVADILLFIAAKCKNAGKIEDFKRAFGIKKDFLNLNQSAANYIPLLINLTAKLKNGGDFTRGVFEELRGILSNIVCDETSVDFELKILKQIVKV